MNSTNSPKEWLNTRPELCLLMAKKKHLVELQVFKGAYYNETKPNISRGCASIKAFIYSFNPMWRKENSK